MSSDHARRLSALRDHLAHPAPAAAGAKDVIVTFGEIMGRLAPPGFQRLRQAHELEVTYAGAEASVASSVQLFGGSARYVTALPTNVLGDSCVDSVRTLGVDCSHIVRSKEGRVGLYFLETGANQRPSTVTYDRADSTISLTPAEDYDWDAIFADAQWLHLSGITPAISERAANATRVAAQKAKVLSPSLTLSPWRSFRLCLCFSVGARLPSIHRPQLPRESVDLGAGHRRPHALPEDHGHHSPLCGLLHRQRRGLLRRARHPCW